MKALNPTSLKEVEAMLEPLNALTGAGSNSFHDAAAYPTEVMSHGFTLGDQWHFQNNPYFNGVSDKEVEQYANYNLLNEVTYTLFAVDASSSSRIDKTFGKSFMLRYMINLIAEVHSPMHNVNGFSSEHPEGDNYGKDYTLYGDKLFDIWERSFDMFGSEKYPLKSTSGIEKFASDIMSEHTRESLATELKEDS